MASHGAPGGTSLTASARELAEAAARRAGLSVNEWLERAIRAQPDVVHAVMREANAQGDPSAAAGSIISALQDADRRVESGWGYDSRPQAPLPSMGPPLEDLPPTAHSLIHSIGQLSRRLDSAETRTAAVMTSIDRAVSAISARLDSAERIKSVSDNAINAAADALSRSTREQSQAFEALEGSLSMLAKRIERIERQGINAKVPEELRDSLSRVTDQVDAAEKQTNRAIGALAASVHNLTSAVDSIQKGQGDTVNELQSSLSSLAQRVEHVERTAARAKSSAPDADALVAVAARLDALAREVEAGEQSALAENRKLRERLAQIEARVEAPRGSAQSAAALANLEAAQERLAERFQAHESEWRSALNAIEAAQKRVGERQHGEGSELRAALAALEAAQKRFEDRLQSDGTELRAALAALDAGQRQLGDRLKTSDHELRRLLESSRPELAHQAEALATLESGRGELIKQIKGIDARQNAAIERLTRAQNELAEQLKALHEQDSLNTSSLSKAIAGLTDRIARGEHSAREQHAASAALEAKVEDMAGRLSLSEASGDALATTLEILREDITLLRGELEQQRAAGFALPPPPPIAQAARATVAAAERKPPQPGDFSPNDFATEVRARFGLPERDAEPPPPPGPTAKAPDGALPPPGVLDPQDVARAAREAAQALVIEDEDAIVGAAPASRESSLSRFVTRLLWLLVIAFIVIAAVVLGLYMPFRGGEAPLGRPMPGLSLKDFIGSGETLRVPPPPAAATEEPAVEAAPNAAESVEPEASPAESEAESESAPVPTPAPRANAATIEDIITAAEAGNAKAQLMLGARYADGQGVAKSETKAAEWLEKAALQGQPVAQFLYGLLLEQGRGVDRNLTEARNWYERSAQAGNRKAMHNLAVLYAEGTAGAKDYALAARWFKTAAELGNKDSQYNLALLCERGLGVELNLAEAYKWFAAAAAQNDADAKRRRDEIYGRLDAGARSEAERAARAFEAKPFVTAANEVPETFAP
ncbi:MAG: hypothetical protein GC199_05090 [Alphaproteobacteria bacterium]|nr:hypothetical protein [Alphaproteobacteria bacterium]